MSIVRIDPEGRRNAEQIAIIVVVDLVPIQCHFRSSSSGATTIADDGHRPIHLIASNPTGVTVTGPALRTVATGPSTCKALACCLQGLGLLHRKLASKAVVCSLKRCGTDVGRRVSPVVVSSASVNTWVTRGVSTGRDAHDGHIDRDRDKWP